MEIFNIEKFKQLDSQKMLEHINTLPDQLADAWELGNTLPLPEVGGFNHVVIAGMGGSAIAGDMVAAYARLYSEVPVTVLRDYTLPKWKDILVICSSHSGNTEETLSVFDQAQKAGVPTLAVTTGGKLAQKAEAGDISLWTFEDDFQPRAAVGYSFGLLFAALTRLGMFDAETAGEEIKAAVLGMQTQQENLLPEVNDPHNPAKRLAGQFIGMWVVLFGSGFLAPIARRWKTQINEIAKAQASFEILPEADHNTLQGIHFPSEHGSQTLAFFINSKLNHPRNKLREELTRKMMMLEGIRTDFYRVPGTSVMEAMWTALHFGDYLSYYLAAAYEVDPTPVPMLQSLKNAIKDAG